MFDKFIYLFYDSTYKNMAIVLKYEDFVPFDYPLAKTPTKFYYGKNGIFFRVEIIESKFDYSQLIPAFEEAYEGAIRFRVHIFDFLSINLSFEIVSHSFPLMYAEREIDRCTMKTEDYYA